MSSFTSRFPSPSVSSLTSRLPSPSVSSSTSKFPSPSVSSSTSRLPSPSASSSTSRRPSPSTSSSTSRLPSPSVSSSTSRLPSPSTSSLTSVRYVIEPDPPPLSEDTVGPSAKLGIGNNAEKSTPKGKPPRRILNTRFICSSKVVFFCALTASCSASKTSTKVKHTALILVVNTQMPDLDNRLKAFKPRLSRAGKTSQRIAHRCFTTQSSLEHHALSESAIM